MPKIKQPNLKKLDQGTFSDLETYRYVEFTDTLFLDADYAIDFDHCKFSNINFSSLILENYVFLLTNSRYFSLSAASVGLIESSICWT